MQHSTRPPTKAESERMARIKELGCVCCRILFGLFMETDVNHIVVGGRRQGHEATYGLCPWHHRGIQREGFTAQQMSERYGPSLARGSKPFHRAFGSDQDLLHYQNQLLEFGPRGKPVVRVLAKC